MKAIALDLATRLGFAHGQFGDRPLFGAHDLGRGKPNGEVLADYRNWLIGTLDEVRPDILCFESPFMPSGHNPFAAPENALTIRRLFAFAGITEAVCHERKLKNYEARPSEITRNFLGGPAPKRRAEKKAATIKMARLLGFDVRDDDEADAVALWTYAESIFAPRMISRRRADAGIELDLEKRPAAANCEASGVSTPSNLGDQRYASG